MCCMRPEQRKQHAPEGLEHGQAAGARAAGGARAAPGLAARLASIIEVCGGRAPERAMVPCMIRHFTGNACMQFGPSAAPTYSTGG